LRQRGQESVAPPPPAKPAPAAKPVPSSRPAAKLSYKDQRELDSLPIRLDKLGQEIAAIERDLADPALYGRDPGRFAALSERLAASLAERDQAEQRWLELEMLREEAERARG
jgi:ATP-binding cassette subfamily F protein uup